VRTVPELRFHWDPTLAYADEVDQILKELAEENESQALPPEESA
jgi:ribosome-binding factor A